MIDLVELLADPETTVAVVGAGNNPAKYGSVIYRDLKNKGYRVFAVNPHREKVDGDPAYPNLSALPEEPTIIDMVVRPSVGLLVLKEADRLGWRRVWFQPGAEDPTNLRFVQERGFDYLADACIMVLTRLGHRSIGGSASASSPE
jgi:uncharacterized protein